MIGQLSENFTLSEFIKSETANKHGFAEQFQPPDNIVDNLEKLCINVLQPLRKLIGQITVSSGYRCQRLNTAVGGKNNSQHMTGHAADIQFFDNGKLNNQMIVDTVMVNKIQFDQMIWENGGKWIHISFKEGKNRNQYFTA